MPPPNVLQESEGHFVPTLRLTGVQMFGSMIAWLDQAIPLVFWVAIAAFVAINGAAAVLFFTRHSREAVNRWTAPLLAVNLALVGAGAAIPATMYVTRAALVSFAPAAPAVLTITE